MSTFEVEFSPRVITGFDLTGAAHLLGKEHVLPAAGVPVDGEGARFAQAAAHPQLAALDGLTG